MAQNGYIKRLVGDRGFGFVTGPDGSEYFFHRSTVADDGFDRLHENEDVTFEVEDRGLSPRGPRCKLVTPVADPLGVAPEPTTRI